MAGTVNPKNTEVWGHGGRDGWSGLDFFIDAMNLQTPVVRVEVSNGVGGTKTVTDPKETAAVQEKQCKIKEEFQKWIFGDKARAVALGSLYYDLAGWKQHCPIERVGPPVIPVVIADRSRGGGLLVNNRLIVPCAPDRLDL